MFSLKSGITESIASESWDAAVVLLELYPKLLWSGVTLQFYLVGC